MNTKAPTTKLLWIDLEMTGLDPENQRIIEVAAIATDFELTELGRYEAIIHFEDEVLNSAEAWPKENMVELFNEVRASQTSEQAVIDQLGEFIQVYFGEEPAVLAGNSIHQDRRFIRQWWPQIETKLHYRMFDVSTLKIWVEGALGQSYEKGDKHRAMGDIEESINELKWAIEKIRD